jgi:broad specificity phosphatase PhoE
MTTFLLIRHGLTADIGVRLSGRGRDPRLSATGRTQAVMLAARLRRLRLAAVYSSPLQRAIETAAPVAASHDLELETRDALGDLDFGEWTGRSFEELGALPEWRAFNEARASSRAPGGERMDEVERRAVAEVESIHDRHPGAAVAVVSHADVIRAVLLHYLGIPIDLYARLEIDPGSVSILELKPEAIRLLRLNDTGRLLSADR